MIPEMVINWSIAAGAASIASVAVIFVIGFACIAVADICRAWWRR